MKGKMMDSRKHRAIIYCLGVCMYTECVCECTFLYVCNSERKGVMTVVFVELFYD